ncbi:hypothetical protein [Paenibacillus sp. PvR098]|uniref:hypothetical protein n=1 Tax=unclassified Paenibacillus TaxID=185978 RepID=UPI0032AE8232
MCRSSCNNYGKAGKIRIVGSPAIQDFWSAVGAGPTPMTLPEVYTSLQTGGQPHDQGTYPS